LKCEESLLSAVNYCFIVEICKLLGITTRLSRSMDYDLPSTDRTDRLVELCRQAGVAKCLSGPAARDYVAAENFADAGIDLEYIDYSGFPVHRQCYPPLEHRVSVVDLILNMVDLILNKGPDARNYMQSFSYRPNPGGGCL